MSLVWILDEEFDDHSREIELLEAAIPQVRILETDYDWRAHLERGRHADVIIAQVYAEIPADLISELDRCRGISVMGGGYDRVDVEAATRAGIPVTNVRGYCAEDIADYVIQAMLHHLKPLDRLNAVEHELPWGLPSIELRPRLSSSRLHIVGLGDIGRVVARRARHLGVRVTATDPRGALLDGRRDAVELLPLAQGLAEADFVSLHVPLTPATRGLIGAEQIALMKRSAVIINTARGGLLDEAAVASALGSGRIAGAVLDVLDHEPDHAGSPLLSAPNALITPHISYASADSLDDLRRLFIGQAVSMLSGRTPGNLVNRAQRRRIPA